jgi:hypothetical protein
VQIESFLVVAVFYANGNKRTITENSSQLQYITPNNAYKCNYLPFSMYHVISIAAVASYFVPLLIVMFKKAWRDQFFLLFAIYWSVGGAMNVFDLVPGVSKNLLHNITIFYNMLDTPFILGILYFTTSYNFVKKAAVAGITLLLLVQVVSIVKGGISYDSQKYALGVGVGVVLCIVSMEIVRYMQKIEHSTRQNAKMFVYAALLFEYATFIVIYIFDYILIAEDRKDSFIIYYVSTLVAIVIASCGFILFRKYESASNYLKA